MYHPKCHESDIGLHLDLPPEPIMAKIDTRRIKQALINLVKNALEASKGQGQIRVSVNIRKDDDCIYVKVSDQGAGIDDKVREKLFTPYFSTKGNGTGLGLAHTQKILQAHKGSVCLLQSAPGQGSTFALVLPRPKQSPHTPTSGTSTTQDFFEPSGQPMPYSV
jgi:signal transduction histidine kinase